MTFVKIGSDPFLPTSVGVHLVNFKKIFQKSRMLSIKLFPTQEKPKEAYQEITNHTGVNHAKQLL